MIARYKIRKRGALWIVWQYQSYTEDYKRVLFTNSWQSAIDYVYDRY